MLHVERDMERHAQCHGQSRPAPSTEQRDRQERRWMMQHACGGVVRRIRLVEETHGATRADLPLVYREPQVMVDVDEDARCPRSERAPTRPGRQRRSPGSGESDVISDPHRCSYDTLMPRTVREGSHARDTAPPCGPSPSRDRSPE